MKTNLSKLFFIIALAFCFSTGASMNAVKEMKEEIKLNPVDKSALDQLLDDYYEENLKIFPLTATSIGDNRYNDQWPNYISQEVMNGLKKFHAKYKERLEKINRESLSEKDKLNYDVIQWECEMGLEGLKFKDYLMPINQIFSQHLFVPQMADGSGSQPFQTVKDYDNWIKRLDEYLEWIDSAIANMKTGIKEGYVLPKVLAVKMIPQFDEITKGSVEEHQFYTPIKNFPKDFNDKDKERLTQEYKKLIGERVIPAYKRMTEFLKNEYVPNCRETAGVSDIPMGKEYYSYCVKLNTTTELTPDEIYSIGEKEVARIAIEMEKIKEQVGFKGTLKEFLADVKTNKDLMPFKTREEVLARFEKINESIKPALSKLFTRAPKREMKIERMAPYYEATSQPFYMPGPFDGSRPGVFYVPIPDPEKYNIYADEVLFVHEGVPGHHYQGDWQMNDTNLPAIRQLVWYVGMGEGWALYAEALGKELGLYKDPYQYLGMLSFDMLRATRLVIDVGLHMKGWTREQAMDYMKAYTPIDDAMVESSIERYMGNPGQALGYKIGQLKILELRSKAEKELGAKFNIAQFHEQVLSAGSVPLRVLENKINHWIETEKNNL